MRMIERLRTGDGGPLLGTWVKIPALETVELLARAGFDFVVIDLEHSPLTLESAYRMVVVSQGLGLHALVRVPERGAGHVQPILDTGVDGVLVPHVMDGADADRVARSMLFPPRGSRGLGTTSRAGMWGLDPTPEYLRRGDEDTLRIPQLEDLSAVEDAEAVLDVPGVNAAFLGMGDLTVSTGLKADDPGLTALTDRLLAAAKDRETPVGTAVRTAQQAKAAADRGFAFVMVGNDAQIFGTAATDLCAAARG
ncbi:4-hydroxy-2-oxoheptanedioate aldolase [Actinomadura madurae]|uniref:4-hydroxy-2-oxoheptanedioate aldolase n=1 Tax=Actinomadura madurae TaxID=1993 RepID=A0A1I5F3X0_9ACTN|nr:aldolase/citrate lyase family protein [Actinomadura madurae]SFO18414.1 4-hydroxy-2-oxoheptanedioate aldolase [Actinomadura madurae]